MGSSSEPTCASIFRQRGADLMNYKEHPMQSFLNGKTDLKACLALNLPRCEQRIQSDNVGTNQ